MSLVEQAVESHVSNTAKRGAPVGMAILWLRVHYRERGHFAQKIRGVHQRCCTKVLPGDNEGPSNQTVQFYARMDRKLFSVCRVHCLPAKGRVALAEAETKDTTRGETMTKKENTGLVLMLGSAAAAIQLTIFFSPILRGWFYSICLGVLIIVSASGADLFRGNE